MLIIPIPSNLNSLNALKFNQALQTYSGAGNYCFDFSNLKFAKPYAMLFLAESIREFSMRQKPTASRQTLIGKKNIHNSTCSYLAHMGFFKDSGINYGNQTGEATGGPNYIPITEIVFERLFEKEKYQTPHVMLENEAKRLARVLTQSGQGDNYEILGYCIRESLRNAMEHSGSDRVRICGQYWQQNNTAQIAILDTGKGFLESLRENSLYETLDDNLVALETAMKPAVSGKVLSYNGNQNVWDNSGFGLYMLKRICKDSGSLLISTNTAALKIENQQTTWHHQGLKGASLKVEINLQKLKELGTLAESLKRYRDESHVNTEPSWASMSFNT